MPRAAVHIAYDPVGLCQPHVGREGLEALTGEGDPLPMGAGQEGRPNDQDAPVGHPQRHHSARQQRRCQKHQCSHQADQVRSRGFRNKDRFRNAIYFHLGDLDLYPEAAKV